MYSEKYLYILSSCVFIVIIILIIMIIVTYI